MECPADIKNDTVGVFFIDMERYMLNVVVWRNQITKECAS